MNHSTPRLILAAALTSLGAASVHAAPPVHAGAAAGGAGAMHAAIPPLPPPVALPAAAAQRSAVSTDVNPTPGAAASARLAATSQADQHGLAVAQSHSASAQVDHQALTATIQQTPFATREALATEISTRVEANERLLGELKTRAAGASGHARDSLARALREVRAAEKDLRASLRAANTVSKESNWGSIQSDLARDYSTYARTVIAAEAALKTSDTPPGN